MIGCEYRKICVRYNKKYNSLMEMVLQKSFCDSLKVPEEIEFCSLYNMNKLFVVKSENSNSKKSQKQIESIVKLE
ncbi:MAG: hypothetical protein OQK82_00075 [Candidatus Pacearchaeota archaeon]|nr:hypothetical protein [Candidatus Pacearchaeota archaeon]